MLAEAGCHERGAGQQFGLLAHPAKSGVKVSQFGPFRAEGRPVGRPLFPFDDIQLGRQFGHAAGADVFPDDAPVDLLRAGVIAALVPAHFCYP